MILVARLRFDDRGNVIGNDVIGPRYEVLNYPGAGHLIEPPYSPHCRACYTKIVGTN